MNLLLATPLLKAALGFYGVGIVAGLLAVGRERAANLLAFGSATLGGLCGVGAALAGLLSSGSAPPRFELWRPLIPYLQLTVKLDALSAFFLLVVSFLAIALSISSLGYAKAFYGRKSVGVLGSFYNALLLATTMVFTANNGFFFLIAWELMALTAFCLVSFEHEKNETRNAGVLYFVMSHIGTGCLVLGFLLLFQKSGNYDFEGF